VRNGAQTNGLNASVRTSVGSHAASDTMVNEAARGTIE
jgi:hypothetical protein